MLSAYIRRRAERKRRKRLGLMPTQSLSQRVLLWSEPPTLNTKEPTYVTPTIAPTRECRRPGEKLRR
jgi:hypothetical protein